MLEARNHSRLILASASPRRKYLLEQAGLRFTVIPGTVDETDSGEETPETHVRLLAEAKADDIARRQPDAWVIGADTVVVIDGRILGKPAGTDEARRMLQRLSGQRHRVHTGFAIVCRDRSRRISAVATTEVEFKTLSAAEIEWYLQTGEPFDKAGAYAIQGIGTFLVRRINGSYTNVVGLPVCEVIEALIAEGVLRY
jgi:septum formation protein